MRSLEGIGQQRFRQGVSYTFAVMPSGRVYEGTGAGRLGSHTGGRNSRSHGIVLVGNYEDAEPPEAMLRGVAELLRHGVRQGWWAHPRLNGGHRDLKQTACPGIKAYRQISRINQMAAGAVAPIDQQRRTPKMVLFWHEGAVYATDGLSRSPWGMAPGQVDALVAGGAVIVGKPGTANPLFELPPR
jgi:hypothetical protein